MVRRAGLSVVLAGVVLVWSCSDDIELPTAYHEAYLSRPSDVAAAVEDGAINVSWSMASEADVEGFVVGFTDSSGAEHTRSIEDPAARLHSEQELDVSPGTVYLIQVWAFDAGGFFGPRSAADTLVVEE
jgi:hypothetical protein